MEFRRIRSGEYLTYSVETNNDLRPAEKLVKAAFDLLIEKGFDPEDVTSALVSEIITLNCQWHIQRSIDIRKQKRVESENESK